MELEQILNGIAKKLSSKRVRDYEVVGYHLRSLMIEASKQMLDHVHSEEGKAASIRIIRDFRPAVATISDLSSKAIDLSIDQLVALTENVSPSEDAIIPSPQEPFGALAEKVGCSFDEIPLEQKAAKAMALESAAVAFDSRISQVEHARFEQKQWTMAVLNSKGISCSARRGLVFCELKAIARDGGQQEGGYDFGFSPCFEDLDPQAIAQTAATRALQRLGAKPLIGGKCPVVFEQKAAAILVRLLAPSFSAENVQKGKSAISSQKGEKIYSPHVSIIDDGLLAGGLGSFPFDWEGIPHRRTTLVKGGAVENWLYDAARANKDKVFSTGNSRRDSLRAAAGIDVTNCFLKPQSTSPNEILRGVQKGFYITELMGVHTVNTITGDFSLGAEGVLIENGVKTAPIRGVTVAGNIHELFKRVAIVGNDLKFHGEYGAPHLLVEELNIAGGK